MATESRYVVSGSPVLASSRIVLAVGRFHGPV
jgi:hypothetical protein